MHKPEWPAALGTDEDEWITYANNLCSHLVTAHAYHGGTPKVTLKRLCLYPAFRTVEEAGALMPSEDDAWPPCEE
jgi:hypothetical protein